MTACRLAVSITAHERVEVLVDQALNILRFCRQPLVMIHLNADFARAAEADPAQAAQLSFLRRLPGVLVNPQHLPTRWAHMFHAHVSNFRLLLGSGEDWTHLLMLSSADLLYRAGIEEHVAGFDAGTRPASRHLLDPSVPDPEHWLPFLRADPVAMRMFAEMGLTEVFKDAHEGSFYRRPVLAHLLQQLDRHVSDWDYDTSYAKEEFFLQNLLRPMPDLRIAPRVSHVLGWDTWQDRLMAADLVRELGAGEDGLASRWAAALPRSDAYPRRFVLSRIPRQQDHPIRRLLASSGLPHDHGAARAVARRFTPRDLLRLERPAREFGQGRAVAGAGPALVEALAALPPKRLLDGAAAAKAPVAKLALAPDAAGEAAPATWPGIQPPAQLGATALSGSSEVTIQPVGNGYAVSAQGSSEAAPDALLTIGWTVPGFRRGAELVALLHLHPGGAADAAFLRAQCWLEARADGVAASGRLRAAAPLVAQRPDGRAAVIFDLAPALAEMRALSLPAGWTCTAWLGLPLGEHTLLDFRLVEA